MSKSSPQLSALSSQPESLDPASVIIRTESVTQDIPITDLRVAPWNARKTFDSNALAELAESIRRHGVLVKPLVRLLPDSSWKSIEDHDAVEAGTKLYEIVAGHRRYQAAQLAGLASLACEVRAMSDDEAREIGLVDNIQREDVPAVEEAVGFQELLERLHSIAAVAARVGKEQSYVARRLKLCSLTLCSQDALRAKLITIDHALLLARLAQAEQDAALKWCLDRNAASKTKVEDVVAQRTAKLGKQTIPGEEDDEDDEPEEAGRRNRWNHQWEPETVQRLKEHIECETGTPLDRAPWPLEEDWLLPDAGSCLDCEKNTKANAPLFGDLDIGVAVCTDGACFKDKTEGFVQIKLGEQGQDLNAKPKKLVPRLSWKPSSVKPATCFNDVAASGAMTSTADPSKVLKAGQWIEAKKASCPNVRAGVTVDWREIDRYTGKSEELRKPGETLQVCIAVGCKVHRKEYEKPKQSSGGQRDEAAEKAKKEARKQAAIAENKLRMAFASAALETVTAIPAEALRRVAQASAPKWGERKRIAEALAPGLLKTLQSGPVSSAEFARALAIISLDDLAAEEYQGPQSGRASFIASVRRLGYKGADPWAKPAAKKAPAAKPAKKAAKKGGRK